MLQNILEIGKKILKENLKLVSPSVENPELKKTERDYEIYAGNVILHLGGEAHRDASFSEALGINKYPKEHYWTKGVLHLESKSFPWYATVCNPWS